MLQRHASDTLSRLLGRNIHLLDARQPEVHELVATVGPELVLLGPDGAVEGLQCLWQLHNSMRPGEGEWESWHVDDVALRDLGSAYGLVHGVPNPIADREREAAALSFGPFYLVRKLARACGFLVKLACMSKFS